MPCWHGELGTDMRTRARPQMGICSHGSPTGWEAGNFCRGRGNRDLPTIITTRSGTNTLLSTARMLAIRPTPWARLIRVQRYARQWQSTLASEPSSSQGQKDNVSAGQMGLPKRLSKGSLYIKVHSGNFSSIHEVFFVLRAVEKKLGRIRDFRAPRVRHESHADGEDLR